MRFVLRLVMSLAAVAAVANAPVAVDAAPDPPAEQRLFDAVNWTRAEHGLPAVTFRDELVDIVHWHTERMAAESRLFHNPDVEGAVDARVPDWQRIGENVGWATSVEGLHQRLMDSPEHRAIILGDYTQLAVGVTHEGDRYWLTQLFIKAPSR